MGDARGRDIAYQDKGNKTIFKDACLWGYQDTYTSNNQNGKFYFEGGVIRGRTDYLCGKGDVYYNGVTAGNDDYSMNSYLGVKTYRDLYKMGMGRFNSLYEGFEPDWNGGWTISRYKMDDGSYWSKTTDNFVQDHNILSFTWQPSAHWTHNAAIHYTYGHGYYKEFRPNYKFAKFGIYATDASGNFVKKADFVRRKGLTQHTYGLVYNANYKDENWDVLGGVNLQQFQYGAVYPNVQTFRK